MGGLAMSTVDRQKPATLPPLIAGQRLDRATFHERYEAMPSSTRAELIGGIVHMPSPLSLDHGDENEPIVGWLFLYRRSTKGVKGSVNASTFLDDEAEPQPDVSLRILPEYGGRTHYEGEYLAGGPELVVEIARSSRAIDLGSKLRDYERAGVPEYLVYALDPQEIFWFANRDGRFVRLAPGADGCYRSEVFPGLWLDPDALFKDDLDGLIATLERGLASAEHAAFVARLAEEKRRRDQPQ